VSDPVVCGNCGAKVRADRPICPRCRGRLTLTGAGETPAMNPRLARAAGAIVATGLLALGGLWMLRGDASEPVKTVTRPPSDPLAARRAAAPASSSVESAPAAPVRPFLEASGQGAVAYASGDFSQSLEHYQDAVEKNPQDAESLSNLGQVLVRLGKVEEALPYFDRAIGLIPTRWAYRFNQARALGLLNRWDEAIASYREAQRLFPNDYATAFNLGQALHRKGDEASAVVEYRKAISLDPNDASFRLALGTSLERLQQSREAAEAYGEYLRLAPAAPDAPQVRERIAQLTGQSATPAGPAGV
jgi:Flp pilus assembly protein TadD